MLITPRCVCASGVKQSDVSVVVRRRLSSSVIQKISKTGDLEARTISKREDNDEIRHILAYVYLMKYKAVVFSAFPPFF